MGSQRVSVHESKARSNTQPPLWFQMRGGSCNYSDGIKTHPSCVGPPQWNQGLFVESLPPQSNRRWNISPRSKIWLHTEKNKLNKDPTSSGYKSRFDCDKPDARKKKSATPQRSALPAYLISHRGGINKDSSCTAARACVWTNSLMSRAIILPPSEAPHLLPWINRA